MLVRKVCSTVSAVLFTMVVMLLGKTVTGKHTRSAVAYDPVVVDTGTVDHHLAAHSLSDENESARLLQSTNNITTSCDEGEEPNLIWWTDGTCLDGSGIYDCCIPIITYTTCDDGYYPYPKNWKNNTCSSSVVSDCCVTFVTSCSEPGEGRIDANFVWDNVNEYSYCYPGISECCGPLLNFTKCDDGYYPNPKNWQDGVCSAYDVSDCCVTLVTSCDEPGEGPITSIWDGDVCYQSDFLDCCGTLLNFTTCDDGYYPHPKTWKNSTCSAYNESDCCVDFVTRCDEPGEGRIGANFEWDSVNEYFQCYPNVSSCCGPKKSTIVCNGDEPLEWPGRWNDGACSVAVEPGAVIVQSDCCYHEDGIIEWIFDSCYESQEQMPGKWDNGNCLASYLSDCCRSVNETTPVFPTGIIDDDGGLSLAAIVGIAVGGAAGLLLVTCGAIALGSRRRKDAETGSNDQKGTTNFQEDAGTIYNEVSEPHIGHVIDRNNSDGETIQVPMGLVVELPESETIHIPSHLVMEVLPQTRHHHANNTSPDDAYPVSQKDQCRSVVGEPMRMVNAVAVQQNSDKSQG
jgi:hypothetical protein